MTLQNSNNRWTDEGLYREANQLASPNFNHRPPNTNISLVVIHNISLPPNQFGGTGVEALFTNKLNPDEHPYYRDIAHIEVSAHFYIRRSGELIQFVHTDNRAWHAGKSEWEGISGCNDYSIGIELEGSDSQPFTEAQYQTLLHLLNDLKTRYPIRSIVGHEHVAPQRKTDPGPFFEWHRIDPKIALSSS
jgi:N-acetyl-anhydromuramoyl-L-alanine amidase